MERRTTEPDDDNLWRITGLNQSNINKMKENCPGQLENTKPFMWLGVRHGDYIYEIELTDQQARKVVDDILDFLDGEENAEENSD